MTKYGIKNVTELKFISPEVELIKQNKPDYIKVVKDQYLKFLNDNNEYIKEGMLNTVADSYSVVDFYDNVIAGNTFYGGVDCYYINPELLKLSLEQKKYIKNEYKVIGEKVISFGKIEPVNINISSMDKSDFKLKGNESLIYNKDSVYCKISNKL